MADKIGVIEVDEIERIGRLAALGAAGCNVVGGASPDEAREWGDREWRQFDVLLFGVVADESSWDRFRCVAIAEQARLSNPNLRLIGLYGRRVRPLVRLRLMAAGVHRAWSVARARTIDDLVGLVSPRVHEGDRHTCGVCEIRGAIVGPHTDPSAVLDHVLAQACPDAFDNTDTQAATGLSRRQIIRLRREISKLGDLSVPSGYATGGPAVDRSLPTWRSCVDYVNRARGFEASEIVEEVSGRELLQLTA